MKTKLTPMCPRPTDSRSCSTIAQSCAALAAILVSAASSIGCHKNADIAHSETPPPTLDGGKVVFPVNSGQLSGLKVESARPSTNVSSRFPARLSWDETVTVRVFSPFGGRVAKVGTEAGEAVQAGAILATISSPDFGQAQADAKRAATDLSLAERTLARLRDLHEHGAAPEKDLQSTEADYNRTVAENTRAQARLAQFASTGTAIDNTFCLRAPAGGVVIEKNVSVGQEVRADQMLAGLERLAAPLFVVTDPSRLWVLIDICEQDLSKVTKGQTLIIRSQSYPGRTFPASIVYISDSLDPITRTVRARAVVSNEGRHLKAEMLVWAEMADAGPASVEVNSHAVFLKGERHFVYAESGRHAFEAREVTIGVEHDGQVQVFSGVKLGERIVSDGAMLLDLVADNTNHSL